MVTDVQPIDFLAALRTVRSAPFPPAGMKLSEFATSGRQLKIRSGVLGEDIIFAADNANVHNPRGLTVYRAAELGLLQGYDHENLRLIHETKQVFRAQVEGDHDESSNERN